VKYKLSIIVIVFVVIIGGLLAFLFYNGILLFNNPSAEKYPIRGIDVSSYQGEIDWEQIAKQNISFAFIKATEGSNFVDSYFHQNWNNAIKTGIKVGAYHFFSFDSGGAAQAENFISEVGNPSDMLPPVIDIELYGDYKNNPPNRENVEVELNIFIEKIIETYGVNPIIYVTKESYNLYIANGFNNCDIWIRDVFDYPTLSDGRSWTFWQFTNRARLQGYEGKEKYIDLNVFNGTKTDFENYGKRKEQ